MFEDSSEQPDLLIDINTTPLIDVMLVLLIMLIVTIPLQPHAVKLDLPVGPPPLAVPPPAISLAIGADGSLRWNAEVLADAGALDAHLAAAAQAAPQPELQILPDRKVAYGRVAQVLAGAQRHGLTRIGVMSTPPAEEGPQ